MSGQTPSIYLWWLVPTTLLVVGMLQLIAWLTLRAGSGVAQVLGAGFCVAAAAISLILLAWVYWRIRIDPENRRPYRVAGLASAVTIGVCLVAFATVTAQLIYRGLIPAHGGGHPGLTEVETLYVWHLVDAVPVLGITSAIRWQAPIAVDDPAGGAMLLLFKVLLLIPLIRVLIAGFHVFVDSLAQVARHPLLRRRSPSPDPMVSPGQTGAITRILDGSRLAVGIFVWSAGAFALLALVVRRSSLADRWVAEHVPATVHALGATASTSWLPLTLDVIATWLIVLMAWAIVDESWDVEAVARIHSVRSTLVITGLVLWMFGLFLLGAVALMLTLLHAGLAETSHALSAAAEIPATFDWLSWHLVDSIPVLDINHTLGWTLDVEYVDRWSGAMLVLTRAVMVAVLLLPFIVVSRLVVAQAATRVPHTPRVLAAKEFADETAKLQALLDDSEHRIRHGLPDTPDHPIVGINFAPGPDLLEPLHRALDSVRDLLGDGPTHDAGRRVIAAVDARAFALSEAEKRMFFARGNPRRVADALSGLDAAHEEALAAARHFDSRLRVAFALALPAVPAGRGTAASD